jgi:predicted phage terminase large subunit-like protein
MGYGDMVERFHRPICDFLDHNPARYKLVQMPRSSFKSSLCTITRNARDALKYPNRTFAILNEVEDRSRAWLVTIRGVYDGNPIIRTLFSDLLPQDGKDSPAWSSKALTLVRDVEVPEPTIAAYGITSSLTGWHHTDWTIDDPISEKAREEPATMQRAIERVSKLTSLMVDPGKDRQTFVGTPWTKHDVIAHFQSSYGRVLSTYAIPAVENDALTFPERLTWEVLEEARRLMGDLQYSAQYLLKPRDVIAEDFTVNDLRYFQFLGDEGRIQLLRADGTPGRTILTHDLDITMTLDPAVSERQSNDRNAIVVVGTTEDGLVIVLDTWAERTTPINVVEALYRMYQRWGPRTVGIEAVAYQKSLKYWVQHVGEQKGLYMGRIRDIPAMGKKEIRIRGLQPLAASGRLYIGHWMSTLREEMLDFPDPSVHDDVLDALSMHLGLFQGVLLSHRREEETDQLKQILRRIDGYGLRADPEGWSGDERPDDEYDFPTLR